MSLLSATGSTVDTSLRQSVADVHTFSYMKVDFAQPFIAAIVTPVIQCCTGGLDIDECEQSCAQIPCQFQACLRQKRLLVVCTVISNWEAVPD